VTKSVVLFDMDGTLTPARKKVEANIVSKLKELSRYAEIGIVTGSDLPYLKEQCFDIWNRFDGCNPTKITLLPCNGTKRLTWVDGEFKLTDSVDMRDHIGTVMYNKLIEKLVDVQSYFIRYTMPVYPLTGTFISYRGSLLNYCPIGRDANHSDRKKFTDLDETNLIRSRLLDRLATTFKEGNDILEMRLGGETSIDIFPTGWDKSFALRYFEGYDVHFVGDRCQKGGNDFDIYNVMMRGNKHSTTGPDNTALIIDKIIEKLTQDRGEIQ